MLPPVVYKQHPQQLQQQRFNEFNIGANGQKCSMIMMMTTPQTTDLKSAVLQNMSPPFREFSPQRLNIGNKSSQLKQSHSALVKILESAPIPSNTSPPQSSTFEKTTTNTTTNSSSNNITNMLIVQQQTNQQTNQQSTYHRKRNKHLNTINAQCDMDKSSDEEIGCNSNSSASSNASSSASSNASEAEIICPWKKTRIAREWHQSQKLDNEHSIDRTSNTTHPTINLNM